MKYKIELTLDADLTRNKVLSRLKQLLDTWYILDPNVDGYKVERIN